MNTAHDTERVSSTDRKSIMEINSTTFISLETLGIGSKMLSLAYSCKIHEERQMSIIIALANDAYTAHIMDVPILQYK